MGAKPGDELEFEETGTGFLLRHRPRISVLDLAGAAAAGAREIPATAHEIDEAIDRAAASGVLAREARLTRHRPSRKR